MKQLRFHLMPFLVLILNLCWTSVGAAEKQPMQKADPMLIDAQLQPYEWHPGQAGKLTLKMTLPPGYHAYENQFDLTILQPDGFKKSSLQIAPLKEWFDKYSNKLQKGVESESTLVIQLEAPTAFHQDITEMKFEVKYQACSEKFCLFPVTREISVPIKLHEVTSLSSNFAANEPVSFFSQANLNQWLGKSLWLALLISFVAGILTSFTPCIFPMIPITLAILGRDVHKRTRLQNFLTSLFYVLGIAITYSSLGLFAATSGKLFGANLGNPWVLGSICLLLFLMALSLFGLYEIQVPAFIRNRLGVQKSSTSYGGALVSGLVAGVVASPCVGPVLVAILTYVAAQKDLVLGFWLLFSYAMGLGMIFLLLGIFTNLLNYLPRSGQWMIRFKQGLGALIIVVICYYLSIALPNNWFNLKPQSSTDYVEPIKNEEWKTYSSELYQQALASGQPIVIDFFAEWCAACHELEEKTFSNAQVKELGKKFVLLRFDATQDSPAMDEFKKKYSIVGLPTVVFYSPKGQWLKEMTLTEFEDADRFKVRLEKVLSSK